MEDTQILDLYFSRSEQAIQETDVKYGGYCYKIAYGILASREDSEESVSDTYLCAWNAIPPRRPTVFSAFLAKLTRNISINHWKRTHAKKRGGGQVCVALEELEGCVSGSETVEDRMARKEVAACLSRFLLTLSEEERKVFLCRYWYVNSIEEISVRMGFTTSKVKSMLFRTREKLKKVLEKEGLR